MSGYRFGPNTAEIERIMRKAGHMTLEQAGKFKDKYTTTDNLALEEVEYNADKHHRTASLDLLVREELVAIFSARATSNQDLDAWYLALLNTRRAVAAVLVKDVISERLFDALYLPWKTVMENSDGK